MKTIHVIPSTSNGAYEQGFYLNRSTMTLIPDQAFVNEKGEFLFETNSFGLRGAEPEEGQPIVVIWGDSVVFSMPGRGWPEQMNDDSPAYLFLNGGVEGTSFAEILKRAVAFNRKRRVELNVILPGWHHFPDNRYMQGDLENALGEIPNAVLATQPTSLNAQIASADLTSTFRQTLEDETHFAFWGAAPYSVQLQTAYFAYICQRNAIVRAVAQSSGTPLIDLFAALDSSTLEDFRKHFFDIGHPRMIAYPMIAKIMREELQPLLKASPARTAAAS
ncbi:MAG: hypothetical protein ACRENA_04955 [Vulcanimicrobiaceae bacterium]